MTWENIEALKTPGKSTTPPHGVRVAALTAAHSARWIKITVGRELAQAVRWHLKQQPVRLMFGTDEDAGKIAVVTDPAGEFVAAQQKNGAHFIAINRHTAEGMFSTAFPAFSVNHIEAIRAENGKPPMFVFRASPEMLDAED